MSPRYFSKINGQIHYKMKAAVLSPKKSKFKRIIKKLKKIYEAN
jgi:hypothetical protein